MRDALAVYCTLLVVGVSVALAGTAAPVRAAVAPQADAVAPVALAPAAEASGAAPAVQANPVTALNPCLGCHSLAPTRKKIAGPPLFMVYGSKPLKASIKVATWDDKNLDRFLLNPEKVDSTTRMFFKVRDPKRRADIIAALKTLK